METPVEKRGEYGHLRSVVVSVHGNLPLFVDVVGAIVIHWLGHARVIYSHADAAREQHSEPGDVVELGRLLRPTQLNIAVLGKGEVQKKHDPNVLGAD